VLSGLFGVFFVGGGGVCYDYADTTFLSHATRALDCTGQQRKCSMDQAQTDVVQKHLICLALTACRSLCNPNPYQIHAVGPVVHQPVSHAMLSNNAPPPHPLFFLVEAQAPHACLIQSVAPEASE